MFLRQLFGYQKFSAFRRITYPFSKLNDCILTNIFILEYQQEIISSLKLIRLQESNKDLYTSGYIETLRIEGDGKVVIELKLDQNFRKIKSLCSDALKKFEWISHLDIRMAPKEQNTAEKMFKKGNLKDVKKIVAVSSCKGGVGKSTVAINLCFALHKLGKSVGIFDADIYGPSLPTLIGKEKQNLHAPADRPKEIIAIEFEGVKAMSYGFAAGNQKAVMRGPMVSNIVTQLVYQTIWEELDYLIVDMPPGTGDVQITLCQELKFDAAVIVTTPQRLSFVDVVKGIEMFDTLKVPTVSVVENMAEFICTNCNHHSRPFGPGYMNMLKKQFGITKSVSIPLYSDISKYSDAGSPVVLTLPDNHTITELYMQLARNTIEEIDKLSSQPPHVRYETGSRLVIVREHDGKEKKIKAVQLRKQCNCALCVDEFSGAKLLNRDYINQERNIDDDVFPHKIEPKGNYAVAIIWSDGHKSSIYPYERLLSQDIAEYKKE